MSNSGSSDLGATRAKIADLGSLLYRRGLTDSAGGNISARVGEVLCVTPRFAGSRCRWKLRPDQVLVVDHEGRLLDGDGEPSREIRVHLAAYKRILDGAAMIHAHPRHVLTFCALGRAIPAVLEAGLKAGRVEVVEWAPAHSPELAMRVSEALGLQEERVKRYGAAVMARWHGLFAMGRDLDTVFDTVERVETGARCYLEMLDHLRNPEAVEAAARQLLQAHSSAVETAHLAARGLEKQVVTITPNTTLDRVVFVPEFDWGRTIRAESCVVSTGGKPEDVSYILGELGYSSLALGFAAGPSGERMEEMLVEQGVQTDFTWVEGETRVNSVIVCGEAGSQSTIAVDTLEVRDSHVADLLGRARKAILGASCLVVGGSLPRGVSPRLYADIIESARVHAVPTLLDSSGEGLRAGLEAKPTVVKPNREELEELTGRQMSSPEDAIAAARSLAADWGLTVVASLGEWGAVAVENGTTWFAAPLGVRPVNSAGAGDGITAGLAIALSTGRPIVEGFRLGCAIAGAVLVRPGTAECRKEDVERFLPEVDIRSVG